MQAPALEMTSGEQAHLGAGRPPLQALHMEPPGQMLRGNKGTCRDQPRPTAPSFWGSQSCVIPAISQNPSHPHSSGGST